MTDHVHRSASGVRELADAQPAYPIRFFVALAATVLIVLAGAVGIVLRGEQVGGTSLTDTFVDNARFGGGVTERSLKVDVLERATDPDFVLLGNSRVQRWDPQRITDATGAHGVNAGLVGLPIRDQRVLVDWIAKRSRADGSPMPHLVYVLPFESLDVQPRGATTLDLPGTPPAVGTVDRTAAAIDRARRLVQWQTVRRALAVLRDGPPDRRASISSRPQANNSAAPPIRERPSGLPSIAPDPDAPGARIQPPVDTTTTGGAARPTTPDPAVDRGDAVGDIDFDPPADSAAPDEVFRADGYLPAGAFFSSSRFGSTDKLRAFVEGQHRQFYDSVTRRGGPGRIEPSARHELERLLATANRADDEPTIVLPPIDPDFAVQLRQLGRDRFADTVRDWLDDLHGTYDFRVLDYSDPEQFGDAADAFYDGVHPRPEITDAMVDQLVRDDDRLTP